MQDQQSALAEQEGYYEEYADEDADGYFADEAENQIIAADQSHYKVMDDRQKLGLVHGSNFKM